MHVAQLVKETASHRRETVLSSSLKIIELQDIFPALKFQEWVSLIIMSVNHKLLCLILLLCCTYIKLGLIFLEGNFLREIYPFIEISIIKILLFKLILSTY